MLHRNLLARRVGRGYLGGGVGSAPGETHAMDTAPERGWAAFDCSMSGVAPSSRIQAAPPRRLGAGQHKRRATFRRLGDLGSFVAICGGVAEETRTRGFAAPAFAGWALVEVWTLRSGSVARLS